MAATSVCCVAKYSFGNIYAHIFSCTVGANTTMAFHSGFPHVKFHLWAPNSLTTHVGPECKKNLTRGTASTSIASAGYISIFGATDGDVFTVIAFS